MTQPEVILSPQAREDIKQIATYIKEDSPQSSLACRHTLENIYEVLLDLPEIGTARNCHNPEMKGLRMLPVHKFTKYFIFYRSTPEGLEIVRVVPGAGSSVFISLRQLTLVVRDDPSSSLLQRSRY